MDEIKAKQQVIEKIKEANKILVTVSDNPSVDALSAALGLTLLLDKQEKYSTAIFSGETPPAIAFLEPEKTFDDTTDSLRDFIIALNKDKADHLRYKIEGDSVKIFITPYKTTISQDDLEYSQGDYNVELVIALGVDNQESLDKALDEHGKILHDATIVTISAGEQFSDLGGVDWHDSNASSLSEMVAGVAEALKDDKKKSLLDTPIATALLTGIVAETDRFSNEHTTSKVMTVSAALMAAGADQQLIATELQRAQEIQVTETETPVEVTETREELEVSQDEALENDVKETTPPKDATILSIAHDNETLADLDERVRGEEAAQEKIEEELEAAEEAAEAQAEKREQEAITEAKPESIGDAIANEVISEQTPAANEDIAEPTFGGALSATADQAEDDKRRAIENDQNKTILSHSNIGESADNSIVSNGKHEMLTGATPAGFPGAPNETPGSELSGETPTEETVHSAYAIEDESHTSADEPSIALGGERVIQPLSDPADVVAPVAPNAPAAPIDLGLPMPPPIPDFSQGLAEAIPVGVPQPAYQPEPAYQPQAAYQLEPETQQPGILGDILAPEPNPAGMAYEVTNTVAAPGSAYAFEETPGFPPIPAPAPDLAAQPQVQPQPAAQPSAPGQFQIPGQQ